MGAGSSLLDSREGQFQADLLSLTSDVPETRGLSLPAAISLLADPQNESLDDPTKNMLTRCLLSSGGNPGIFGKLFLKDFIHYGLRPSPIQVQSEIRADHIQAGNYASLYIVHIVKHFGKIEGELRHGLIEWFKSCPGSFGYSAGENNHAATMIARDFTGLFDEIIDHGTFNVTFERGTLSIQCANPIAIWTKNTVGSLLLTGENRMPLTSFDEFLYIPEDCFPRNSLGERQHVFFMSLILAPGRRATLGSCYEMISDEVIKKNKKLYRSCRQIYNVI